MIRPAKSKAKAKNGYPGGSKKERSEKKLGIKIKISTPAKLTT